MGWLVSFLIGLVCLILWNAGGETLHPAVWLILFMCSLFFVKPLFARAFSRRSKPAGLHGNIGPDYEAMSRHVTSSDYNDTPGG
jgi:hypothetical protein